MRPAEWEACPGRDRGLEPEAYRFVQGLAWASALSAPFWALLLAIIWF